MDKQLEQMIIKSVLTTVTSASGCLLAFGMMQGNQKFIFLAFGIGLAAAYLGG
jgi:hypothetical protein